MNGYTISNDFFEIISGTTNKLHPLYMEASKNVDSNNSKSVGYIKNFVKSIVKPASIQRLAVQIRGVQFIVPERRRILEI